MTEIEFGQFFESMYSRLIMFAQRFLGDKELSADVVSDSFIKFWENREQYSIHPKSAMYTIVKNKCIDELRRSKRNRKVDISKAEELETEVERSVIRLEYLSEIIKVIQTLPTKAKLYFKLFYLEGMSLNQISNITNSNINTIKSLNNRSLKKLKAFFK